ncbi:MAG: 50S ribosomal protein L30 [Bacteroidetes bacterium]|nr:50S ribosomal protein L30 [Bacteroidota bacterium]
MAMIKITQIKSKIGRTKRQKKTLEALGLKRVGYTVEHVPTNQIIGMVSKVLHLVKVEGELVAERVDAVEKMPAAKKKPVTTKKTTSKKSAEAKPIIHENITAISEEETKELEQIIEKADTETDEAQQVVEN